MATVLSLHQAAASGTDIAIQKLSVVIPVYNEVHTVAETVARVRANPCVREIILVDDGSCDGTSAILDLLGNESDICAIQHDVNLGKGAALRSGFAVASAEIVLVQDADSEYDPTDYEALIKPILTGEAEVVYGSRFLANGGKRMPAITRWANRFITAAFNWGYGSRLTDVETCYKAIRRDKLAQVLPQLKENRFGIEIELTARLSQLPQIRIAERPISYSARTYSEGKKIGWRDGLRAIWCIGKYRFSR